MTIELGSLGPRVSILYPHYPPLTKQTANLHLPFTQDHPEVQLDPAEIIPGLVAGGIGFSTTVST